jgi:hypothetical protein
MIVISQSDIEAAIVDDRDSYEHELDLVECESRDFDNIVWPDWR